MDFLNNFERKYIPSIHKFRYDQRKSRVNSLKQVCLHNPQQLAYQDVRVILRILKHYKLLPISEEYIAKEKFFMFKAGENFLYACLLAATPFLAREFYAKSFMKKITLITGIFLTSYGLMMRGPFLDLDQYNRKLAQENIHKFSPDLEQEESEPEKVEDSKSTKK